jgi:hypothetical protein
VATTKLGPTWLRNNAGQLHDTLVAWGQAGVPGFAEMLRDGHADGIRNDIACLRANRPALEALRQ